MCGSGDSFEIFCTKTNVFSSSPRFLKTFYQESNGDYGCAAVEIDSKPTSDVPMASSALLLSWILKFFP
jgi:hypothetical protein